MSWVLGVQSGQERELDPLKLELGGLRAIMWMLETELGSSSREHMFLTVESFLQSLYYNCYLVTCCLQINSCRSVPFRVLVL